MDKTLAISSRMPQSLVVRVQKKANHLGLNRSKLIMTAVEHYLQQLDQNDAA